MVLIAGLPALTPAAAPSVRRTGASGFAVPDQPASPGAQREVRGTGGANALTGAMMLTIQEGRDREQADEEARRHGRSLLEELKRLQRALLSGGDPASLERLEELSRVEPGDIDPALAGILSSIRLRARIELARRTPGQGSRLTNK